MSDILDRADEELLIDEYQLGECPVPIVDQARHLVCYPYSIPNLHKVASVLGIKRCWFHKDHYDIPKGMIEEVTERSLVRSSRDVMKIARGYTDGADVVRESVS